MCLSLLNIDLTKVDRFIFSRHCDLNKEGHERISELLQEHDVKVIIDLDDYWVLPSDNTAHVAYESLVDPNQGIRKSIERSISMADHMWTPSPIIAKMARKVNPKITHTIVPNAINPGEGHWNMTKTFNSEKEVRFGYTGANNHMGDLEPYGYRLDKALHIYYNHRWVRQVPPRKRKRRCATSIRVRKDIRELQCITSTTTITKV